VEKEQGRKEVSVSSDVSSIASSVQMKHRTFGMWIGFLGNRSQKTVYCTGLLLWNVSAHATWLGFIATNDIMLC
jgi:hypothetical protein